MFEDMELLELEDYEDLEDFEDFEDYEDFEEYEDYEDFEDHEGDQIFGASLRNVAKVAATCLKPRGTVLFSQTEGESEALERGWRRGPPYQTESEAGPTNYRRSPTLQFCSTVTPRRIGV
ncbi:MAG: hypothetical protein R2867_22925 [Caldilineaceae bacterium]